jgi:hypothetical protein
MEISSTVNTAFVCGAKWTRFRVALSIENAKKKHEMWQGAEDEREQTMTRLDSSSRPTRGALSDRQSTCHSKKLTLLLNSRRPHLSKRQSSFRFRGSGAQKQY